LCVALCLNVCTLYGTMFGAWKVSPYWFVNVYGTIFAQVRRVGEGNRNLKKIWLLAGVRLAAPSRMARQRVRAVVWTSLGPLPRWVPGPTTRWAPGTTRLALHGT
jgi:hypothetical protein